MIQVMLTESACELGGACETDAVNLLSVAGQVNSRHRESNAGSSICKVALEEHVGFKSIWNFSNAEPPVEWWQNKEALEDLEDGHIDETRMRIAKKYGVDFMILSITGSTQDMKDTFNDVSVAQFSQWNLNFLTKVRKANAAEGKPHVAGFCFLPLWDPQASILQFKECLQHGAVGALINGYDTSNTGGDFNYYITKEYYEFWDFVEKSGKPIYLHPREAEPSQFFKQFPEMRVSPWGFHVETAEHALRFILSGFFDRFPKVKLILGHDGEILIWMAWRIDHRLKKQGWTPESLSCHTGPDMKLSPCPENGLYKRKHNVTYYLKNNFHITTSGMFDTPGFRHALSVMGPERVMFSIDTAYEDISDGAGWFNSLSETVALPQKDWESIAFRNAAKLFDLSVCGM